MSTATRPRRCVTLSSERWPGATGSARPRNPKADLLPIWTNYELRHAALSRIRFALALEAAAAVGGHSATEMTEHYSRAAQQEQARRAAAATGWFFRGSRRSVVHYLVPTPSLCRCWLSSPIGQHRPQRPDRPGFPPLARPSAGKGGGQRRPLSLTVGGGFCAGSVSGCVQEERLAGLRSRAKCSRTNFGKSTNRARRSNCSGWSVCVGLIALE